MSDPTPPPLSGIARATRKDKGIPRRNTLDSLYDTFADLDAEQQRVVLAILGVIHRQALRNTKEETIDADRAG
jgi:hypothetical protein